MRSVSFSVCLLLLFVPAVSAQQTQCSLEGSPEAYRAQQMLTQAQDTLRPEAQRRAANGQAWNAVEGPIQDGTDNPTPYILGAQAQVGFENYARADSLLNQFLARAGEGCEQLASQIRFQVWANLYNAAIEAFNAERPCEALTRFEEANRIYQDARSYVNAAALYEKRGDSARAAFLYDRALSIGGDSEQMSTARASLDDLRVSDEEYVSSPLALTCPDPALASAVAESRRNEKGGGTPKPSRESSELSWSGTGDKTTQSFTASSPGWRLEWTVRGGEMSSITIFVKRADTGTTVSSASSEGPGTETSYVHETGRFYLEIVSANAEWAVQVVMP